MRAMFVVAALGLAAAAPAQAQVAPEYFKLPSTISGIETTQLAVGGDGAVYFGAKAPTGDLPLLGRLDPAQASPGTSNGVTGLPTPARTNGGSGPILIRDVVYTPKSKFVWFTRSDGKVVRWDGSTMQGVSVTGDVDTWGAAPDADGGVWVAEHGAGNASSNWKGNRLARISPNLGLQELTDIAHQPGFDELHYDSKPRGVASTPDGTPWFVQYDAGHGYRIATPGGSGYLEYRPPCVAAPPGCSGSSSGPSLSDVTVAPDGAVWYTNELTRSVGRLVPGVSVAEYRLADMDLALGGGLPRAITTSGDGTLWLAVYGGTFSGTAANALVQINPGDLTKTIYKTGAGMAPGALATDAKGNVWFSGGGFQNDQQIGRLAVGGTTITEPPVGGGGGGGETPVTPISQRPGPQPTALTPAVATHAEISQFKVSGDTVSANQICVGPPSDPCSLVYLLQTHEYVKGFPGTKANASAAKLTTIGQLKVTLKGGQSKKVTIKLNAKGKKLRKKLKSFKATLTVTQTVKGTKKPKQVLKKNLTFKRG